ncbi:hypothetical protein AAFF_G00340870 [Aldrovandia affinis]|uniref:Uncharacterized protein n=1 Tax=Aldrovandia affinis TaxID=143900 RepID=A0AAD7SKI9_9TELE|nr:hypothetical protein AAFF_G00340870 [Aldrovandia affinis]
MNKRTTHERKPSIHTGSIVADPRSRHSRTAVLYNPQPRSKGKARASHNIHSQPEHHPTLVTRPRRLKVVAFPTFPFIRGTLFRHPTARPLGAGRGAPMGPRTGRCTADMR